MLLGLVQPKGRGYARESAGPGRGRAYAVFLAIVLAACRPVAGQEPPDLQKPVAAMSLEELVNVDVTSVSRGREPLLEAPAAVYVLTQEDIRRSGATTIVEALRLVPGVDVARINASQWSVGIRGFASRLSRAVLVLIDGRSVYTPLFAGVFWEAQDTMLEDIDRIEVIRGPGGALWGANAVNGVINIITKKAKESQGGLVSAAGGTEDRFLGAARYGGTLGGGKTSYRLYGKYSDRDAEFHAHGSDFDAWHMEQGGFRADTSLSTSDVVTVQGDGYSSRIGQRATPSFFTQPYIKTVDADANLSGGNVLARWGHTRADGSELLLQAYYDYTHHAETIFAEDRDNVDVDFQNRSLLGNHSITYGLGFRWNASDTSGVETVTFTPARRTDELYSAFVQDEISLLSDRLRLTLGAKVEHNVYTGFEVQPTGRLVWIPREGQAVWAAVSRAVRTPSRIEFDLTRTIGVGPTTPLFVRITGDGKFVSEELIAYEAGYRLKLGKRTLFDLTAFYNDYSNLTSGEPAGPPFQEGEGSSARFVLPFVFRNGLRGRGTGAELSADTNVTDWLTIRAWYAYLSLDLKPGPTSADTTSGPSIEGSSPRHNASVAAHTRLPRGFEADAILRYTSRLPSPQVPAATDFDLRLGWRNETVEVSLVGQGLRHPHRLQFPGGESGNVEIQRAFYGKLTWRF
jgi:iron complex outermembrane recepter protein